MPSPGRLPSRHPDVRQTSSPSSGAPMSAFLPAFDPDPETRAAARTTRQGEYRFNHAYVSPLALIEDVPSRDRFPIDFTTLVLGKLMTNVVKPADADSSLRRQLRMMDTPRTAAVLAGSTAVRAVAGVGGHVIGVLA